MARFEIFKGRNGQFYWHLKSPNNETLCVSEGYLSKQSAQNGISAVKRAAPFATTVDLTLGQFSGALARRSF